MHSLVLLLAATTGTGGAPNRDEVVARANATAITAGELADRAATTRAAGGDPQPDLIVQDLINEALMAEEGLRAGLARDAEVVAEVDGVRRRRAADRLLEKEIAGVAKLDDAGLLEMYHASADTVRFEKLVLATRDEAQAALDRLKKGASLAEEAKHSYDADMAARGGQAGTRSRGQLEKALEAAVFSAPLRTFTGPVQLELGWAVVRVQERQLGDEAGFQAKRDELRRFAEMQMRSQYKAHYVAQLRKQADLKIDEAFLKGLGARLSATPAEADHVIATVNGRKLRYGAVADEVRRLFGGKEGGHASGPSVKIEYAWSLADRMLIEDAAMARGFGDDPGVRAAAAGATRDAVVRAFSARLRKAAGQAGGAEIEGYYRGHQGEFRRPARRSCSQIAASSRDEADRLWRRVQKGEPFERVAREASRDPTTASKGGLIGEIADDRLDEMSRPGGEPAFAAAVRRARPGELMGPVQTRAGWHVLRCDAPRPAEIAPLPEVRAAIAARLGAQRGDDAVRRRIAELRQAARIEIERAALARATGPIEGSKP